MITEKKQHLLQPVPLHICNAPTDLMKELDYGKGYIYAHDTEEKLTKMKCLPEALEGRRYYQPTEQGQEKQVKERLEEILRWKQTDFYDKMVNVGDD